MSGISEKNKALELERMMKFWERRERIFRRLAIDEFHVARAYPLAVKKIVALLEELEAIIYGDLKDLEKEK